MSTVLLRSGPNRSQVIAPLPIATIRRRNGAVPEESSKKCFETPSGFEGRLDIPRMRDPQVDVVQSGGWIRGLVENMDGLRLRPGKAQIT